MESKNSIQWGGPREMAEALETTSKKWPIENFGPLHQLRLPDLHIKNCEQMSQEKQRVF